MARSGTASAAASSSAPSSSSSITMSRKASAAVAPIGVAGLGSPGAHAFGQRLEVVDLAGVGAERVELAVQRRGHVDPDIGVVRPEEVQPPDPVRREAAACEPRERHRVARRRVGRVDRRHARGAVVGVVHAVGAVEDRLGVGREDGVRTEGADLADELLAEGQVVGQRTVGSVEERDPGVADHVGRGPLLRLADRRQLERVEVRVLAARVAARAAHEPASEPSAIQRAHVAAGPKSASSGWPAMTMKRAGRQPWSRGGRSSIMGQPALSACSERLRRPVAGAYSCGRGFARLPPRAKPLCFSWADSGGALSAREPSGARRGRRGRRRHGRRP